MKDEQKVYIKGDSKRGAEIIKLLKNLGGRNCYNCKGDAEKNIYYINPLGDISCVMECQYSEWLLVKEFYEEIKLPRWKPDYCDNYFYVCDTGRIRQESWQNTKIDNYRYSFGNCFMSYEEAKEAINKIKNVLNQ
jgi:hypothetical protein